MRPISGQWSQVMVCAACLLAATGPDAATALGIAKLEPSVRALGAGRAATAVFWGPDPDAWRNPALLACQHGLRYQRTKAQLVPDLTDDVFYTADRLAFAAFGVGVSLEGQPFDALGGQTLDYGETEAVDEEGVSLGFFDSWEDVRSWGLAVSAVHLLDNALDLATEDHQPLRRFGDVSVGVRWNTVDVFLAPEWALESIGIATEGDAESQAKTRDWGYTVRLSPYNSVDYEGWLPALDEALAPVIGGFALEAAYGEGMLNEGYDQAHYPIGLDSDPIVRQDRRGYAVRLALGLPGRLREGLESSGLGWVAQGLSPLISFGRSWDRLVLSGMLADGRGRWSGIQAETRGWELTLANIFTLRRGRIDDPEQSVRGDTSGWGLGFRVADYGGFRYDHATVPQAYGLEDVDWEGFTLFADPLAIWHAVRH